jgi:hypothetical protein
MLSTIPRTKDRQTTCSKPAQNLFRAAWQKLYQAVISLACIHIRRLQVIGESELRGQLYVHCLGLY